MLKRKMTEEKSNAGALLESSPAKGHDFEHANTMTPTLERKIIEELGDHDSISSAVFENIMRNSSIKEDVLRELKIHGHAPAAVAEENNATQYSGGTFVYKDNHTGT